MSFLIFQISTLRSADVSSDMVTDGALRLSQSLGFGCSFLDLGSRLRAPSAGWLNSCGRVLHSLPWHRHTPPTADSDGSAAIWARGDSGLLGANKKDSWQKLNGAAHYDTIRVSVHGCAPTPTPCPPLDRLLSRLRQIPVHNPAIPTTHITGSTMHYRWAGQEFTAQVCQAVNGY